MQDGYHAKTCRQVLNYATKVVDMYKMDAMALAAAIKNKEISAVEAVEECACNIKDKEDRLNALISSFVAEAKKQAKSFDEMKEKLEDVLAGIPFVAKDNICYKDKITSCASKMLQNYKSPYTATALKKVLDVNGICMGKANMDEFAMGATGETSYFGKTLNPLDERRVPGGSSSGSAAAVAAGYGWYALGSDSGGSVRLPAAYCGLVGMLPTYGRVSRYGLVAHVSSMDQIGPISKTVRDCAAVLNLICGKDKHDATTICTDTSFNTNRAVSGMKVAISEVFMNPADDVVKSNVYEAAKKLESSGVEIHEVDLSFLIEAPSVYSILSAAEASSNLARYDGLKYGGFDLKMDLDNLSQESRRMGFGDEVKRRIFLGAHALSDGYEDYFIPADKKRRELAAGLNKLFENYDAVILPVSKTIAPFFDESFSSAKEVNATDIFTVTANLAQLPAISVPFGSFENMPLSVQLMGKPYEENTILALAQVLERN